MEYKELSVFEIKATDDGRTITGYGSVSGNVDRGNDVVVAGAFAKSIASGRMPKMLYQHNSDIVIGKWTVIAEDEKGLKVEGVLADTPKGNELKELIKMGAIDGLSIGYRTIDADYNADGVRLIKEAELWEISVVTFPMNESASITGVKAAEMSKTDLEKFLRGAGLSRSEAKGLIAKGYEGLTKETPRKAEEDSDKQEVISEEETKFLAEMKELLNRRIENLR